jgi:hypothetical protein
MILKAVIREKPKARGLALIALFPSLENRE